MYISKHVRISAVCGVCSGSHQTDFQAELILSYMHVDDCSWSSQPSRPTISLKLGKSHTQTHTHTHAPDMVVTFNNTRWFGTLLNIRFLQVGLEPTHGSIFPGYTSCTIPYNMSSLHHVMLLSYVAYYCIIVL